MTTKAEVWRGHLDAWRRSERSIAAYCREHGLGYAQFMYWQRRLGRSSISVMPVHVQTPAPASAALSVELSCPGGVALRISGASAGDVAILVRQLAC